MEIVLMIARIFVAAAIVASLGVGSAAADDITNLMNGTPSVREVVEALQKPLTRGIQPAGSVGKAADFRVLFEFDSSVLTPEARRVLDQVGQALRAPELEIDAFLVEGHTDAVGPEGYNLDLSEQRAASVRRYLVDHFQLAPERLTVEGKGESDLLEGLDPGAADNRRVRLRNMGASPVGR